MDADSWSASFSSVSKRYQSAFQTRSDVFMGFEEIEGDDDIREEFPCHIDDEHPVEAKNGVCPVCAMRVGVDMVAHITLQHGNIFNVQRKRKSRRGSSHSTLSFLRKELQEGNLQSLFGGSSCIVSSSNTTPDPLLSSFIFPMADDAVSSLSQSLADTSSAKKGKEENTLERNRNRNVQSSILSIKDQQERARRSEFVHGLLLSTIFDDML